MSDPGVAFAVGPCVNCRQLFSFNPLKVPSVRVNGVREPVCKTCFDTINADRAKAGLPAFPLHAEAYSVASADEVLNAPDEGGS